MTAAARRPLRWIIPSAIAILVIAVGGVAWAQLRPASPSAVATQFWQLLADGKAQQALALTTHQDLPNGLLLTDAVYGKADRGIGSVKAGSTTTHGDAASVDISFTDHGTPATARVELRKHGNGPLHPATWQVTNAPISTVTATVASGGQAKTLAVNGTALPVAGDGRVVIPALPGRYTFALGTSSKLLAAVPQKVVADAAPKPAAVTLKLAASPAASAQAVAAAQKMLAGCFTPAQGIAASCPMRQAIINMVPLTAEDGLLYKLGTAPKLALNPETMQVTSTANGTMLVSTIDHVWGNLPNSATFSVAFDVKISGDKLTVTPHGEGVSLVDYTGATA